MKVTITTTTINVPYLIEDYIKDIIKHERQDYVDFVITGDKKTPRETAEFCKEMQDQYKIPVLYMDVEAQNEFMKDFKPIDNFIPWNCLQRRNIAILKAYKNGSDVIILIDDDNYLACEDYVGKSMIVGTKQKLDTVASPTNWYNICEHLKDKNDRYFYPRGYSWGERIELVKNNTWAKKEVRSVVNGGFWLGDPDIDAVTRLAAPIDVVEYTRKENFALDKNTYCPFNSQNTALHRDIVPAYFLCNNIGRFDDIWASFVIERIAWHLDDYISFGQPLVVQNRNDHDLWIDAYAEEEGTKYTPDFCKWLAQVKLTKTTYKECAIELMDGLKKVIDSQKNDVLPFKKRAFINHFIDGYKLWADNI